MKVKMPDSERLPAIRARVLPSLQTLTESKGAKVGEPVFIRIFKESSELELWMRPVQNGVWRLVKTYPIATYGGKGIGPKLQEGDLRAPEGFYTVGVGQLNPQSDYHLAFNIGYPNDYDAAHGRTGSLIMLHGSNVSIGCFAMTDPGIEEIYLLVEAALKEGQDKINVHIFPFHLTPERLAKEAGNSSLAFWKELEPGYAWFEKNHLLPNLSGDKNDYDLR